MGKELVTLDTLEPERDFIKIDEKVYFLHSDGELDLTAIAKLRRMAQRLIEIDVANSLEESSAEEVKVFASDALDIIVIDLPAEVKARLKLMQRLQIVKAFTHGAFKNSAKKTPEGESPEDQPTSEESSQASGASTEGQSKTS